MPEESPDPRMVVRPRRAHPRLRILVKLFIIIFLFSAINSLLYSHFSTKLSSLPLPGDGALAVGFDLTESYGCVVVRFLSRIVALLFFMPFSGSPACLIVS